MHDSLNGAGDAAPNQAINQAINISRRCGGGVQLPNGMKARARTLLRWLGNGAQIARRRSERDLRQCESLEQIRQRPRIGATAPADTRARSKGLEGVGKRRCEDGVGENLLGSVASVADQAVPVPVQRAGVGSLCTQSGNHSGNQSSNQSDSRSWSSRHRLRAHVASASSPTSQLTPPLCNDDYTPSRADTAMASRPGAHLKGSSGNSSARTVFGRQKGKQ